METNVTKTNRLVLKGDQIFREDVFLTPVGDIGNIIDTKLKENTYFFLPMYLPPMLKKWVKGHWFGSDPLQKQLLCFTEVEYIPLKGAKLDDDGILELEGEGTRDFDQKWTPPKGVRPFIMISWDLNLKQITQPILFMLVSGVSDPVTPNIPNVFDTGKICTGSSYKNRNDTDVLNTDNYPLHHIKYGLDCLHESPMNKDLRGNDNEFMQWDSDGEQREIPLKSTHFKKVSDERVVHFFKWASVTKI